MRPIGRAAIFRAGKVRVAACNFLSAPGVVAWHNGVVKYVLFSFLLLEVAVGGEESKPAQCDAHV